MGFFDFFSRENTKDRRVSEGVTLPNFTEDNTKNTTSTPKNPIAVFSPKNYREVETIIDALKNGKTAIVHLTDLKTETAIRILDMLSGAVYAIDGGVYEMEKNIFMFSPTGVEIK